MNGLIAILRHEVAGHRLLLGGALALGLVPLAAPLLLDTPPAAVPEMRATLALFLAFALSGLAAVLLGATAIGGDLAERRLSFFFTRPLSWWTIWAGKLGAAALCAWATGLLVLLPALLASADRGLRRSPVLERSMLTAWAVALPLLLLAAHAAGVILRTRSAWLVLDVLGLAAAGGIAWAAARRLVYWNVVPGLLPLAQGAALTAVGVLLVASAVQLAGGRTDPARAHRLLSVTLATTGLAAALAFAVFAEWRIDVPLGEVKILWTLANGPDQGWVAIGGTVPGPLAYQAAFLVQPATGRTLRLRTFSGWPWFVPLAFSADGRHALWAEPEGAAEGQGTVLVGMDLGRAGARPVRTLIGTPTPPGLLLLSPHGERAAVDRGGIVSIFDVASGRVLATHASGQGELVTVRFDGEDRLLWVLADRQSAPPRLYFRAMDLTTDLQPRQLGTLTNPSVMRSVSPDLRHVVFSQRGQGTEVFEVATGSRVGEMHEAGAKIRAVYMSDGRLAEIVHTAAATEVVVRAADGGPVSDTRPCRLPAASWVVLLQASHDELVAMTYGHPKQSQDESCDMAVLDLHRGTVRSLGGCLEPVWPALLFSSAALSITGNAPLFVNAQGKLVRVDLTTGARRVVALGGGGRPFWGRPF